MSGRLIAVLALLIAAAVGAWLIFADRTPAPRAPVDIPEKAPEGRPEQPGPASQPLPPIRPRSPRDAEEPPIPPPPIPPAPPAAGETREPGPIVAFVVTDAAGAPIEKARVFAGSKTSDPTDAAGHTKLEIVAGTRSVVAGAPRFRLMSFPLPEKLPESIELELEPSVTLVVRVRHEDPSIAFVGQLALTFDVDEWVVPSTGSREFNDVRGAVPVSGSGSGNHQTRTYAVRPGEDIVVSGFNGGDEIEAAVEDPHHQVIMSEKIKLPGNGETHPIELVVRSKPRVIKGTVLDHESKPLAGARVGIDANWIGLSGFLMPGSLQTDASGKFKFENVYAASPSLAVSASGHASRTIMVDISSEPLTIQLERGRNLAVTVTGVAGGIFRGQITFEIDGVETYNPKRRAEKILWFDGVPCRPGILRATGSGEKETTLSIGAEETEASIAAPE